MENFYNEKFLEEIWNDANFKSSKTFLLNDTTKKDKIRKLNQQGKIVAYCKVCNKEIYISNNYNGEFPLCIIHRDPTDRPDKHL